MCRWMAWHGQPVIIGELLLETKHGLIDQSRRSRMGAETTNEVPASTALVVEAGGEHSMRPFEPA
jgi:predicted glutamine amidotransferase